MLPLMFVNGTPVRVEATRLNHNDRIVLGSCGFSMAIVKPPSGRANALSSTNKFNLNSKDHLVAAMMGQVQSSVINATALDMTGLGSSSSNVDAAKTTVHIVGKNDKSNADTGANINLLESVQQTTRLATYSSLFANETDHNKKKEDDEKNQLLKAQVAASVAHTGFSNPSNLATQRFVYPFEREAPLEVDAALQEIHGAYGGGTSAKSRTANAYVAEANLLTKKIFGILDACEIAEGRGNAPVFEPVPKAKRSDSKEKSYTTLLINR